MTDPVIEAARTILDGSLDALRSAVDGATLEELSWRPAGEDTNPIVVLAVHGIHSTRWWLSVATGAAQPERDRPSEFRATAEDPAELRALVEEVGGDCRALLVGVDVLEPALTWTSPVDGEVVTRGWALVHALEHLREHVAQALLTRQLWSHRQG